MNKCNFSWHPINAYLLKSLKLRLEANNYFHASPMQKIGLSSKIVLRAVYDVLNDLLKANTKVDEAYRPSSL